ncbi:hypothetical protein QYE76_007196 [Lolium multiflorum]|uniref:Nuclease HARBI1 n=1 Tax=Lolium multiflorum TaxID=4521 RepID=A0AAD8W536_LOLMU|nr:hypothetical protein QYE76_007196 [Lolium multiflorum]
MSGRARLHKDYFHITNPIYPEKLFRRRYRMSRDLFLVILRGIRNYDPYFQCRPAATGMRRDGLSFLKTMHEVMTCCVIMHNMIVENERPDGRNENHWEFQELTPRSPLPRPGRSPPRACLPPPPRRAPPCTRRRAPACLPAARRPGSAQPRARLAPDSPSPARLGPAPTPAFLAPPCPAPP